MAAIRLAIVNRSKTLRDEELIAATAALQIQVDRDFAPAWGISASLGVVPAGEEPPDDMWQQVVVDKPQDPDALGYHETTRTGLPVGFTSLEADAQAGEPWQPTLSHELLEMLADPFVFSLVAMGRGRYAWQEVCDAVEALSYNVTLESGIVVPVSDFQLPAWFGAPRASNVAPFSFLGSVKGPFELAPGGYIGVIKPSGQVRQITARRDPARAEKREAAARWSRRWRRQQAAA